MRLEDVLDGQRIFIDANILIYHFSGISAECRSFLERCESRQVIAFKRFSDGRTDAQVGINEHSNTRLGFGECSWSDGLPTARYPLKSKRAAMELMLAAVVEGGKREDALRPPTKRSRRRATHTALK